MVIALYSLPFHYFQRGQLVSATATQGSSTQTTTNAFTWYIGPEKLSTTITGTGAQAAGTSTYSLNALGLVTAISYSGGTVGNASYIYDAFGQGIVKSELLNGFAYDDVWYRMGGVNMWHRSNRFDPRYGDADTSSSRYTVKAGDTLTGIAQLLWGDSALWYKLAEANGLTSASASLTEGQQLMIPAGVWRNHHNASTYIPYDVNAFLADGGPQPLYPTPTIGKGPKCGVMGQVLLVAIAVAVSIALPGGGTVLGAALNAAIGSAVSQGVGLATGIQEKFSFKQVAISAITAGVTQGISQGLSGLSKLGEAVTDAQGKIIKAARVLSGTEKALKSVGTVLSKGNVVASAIRGAAGSAITQGIATATGLQDRFSFTSVAAAGAGAGLSRVVGGQINIGGRFGAQAERAITSMAGAIANAGARSILKGNSFGDNLIAALPDTIGQTIGALVADGVRGGIAAAKAKRELATSSASTSASPQSLGASDIATLINGPSRFGEGLRPFAGDPASLGGAEEILVRAKLTPKAFLAAGHASQSEAMLARLNAERQAGSAPLRIVSSRPLGLFRPDANGGIFIDTGKGPDRADLGGNNIRFTAGKAGAIDIILYETSDGHGIYTYVTDKGVAGAHSGFSSMNEAAGIKIEYGSQAYSRANMADALAASFDAGMKGIDASPDFKAWRQNELAKYAAQQSALRSEIGWYTARQLGTFYEIQARAVAAVNPYANALVTAYDLSQGNITPLDAVMNNVAGMKQISGLSRLKLPVRPKVGEMGGLGSSRYATDGDLIQSIATRADKFGGRGLTGNGPIIGTYKHEYSKDMLVRYQRMFGDRGLSAEVRYVGGGLWERGMTTTGSIRLDVVKGPLTQPTFVWDYKFGGATLSQPRITTIKNGIPNGANVPIIQVKP